MAKTKYFIYLTDEDRSFLNQIIKEYDSETAMRARILLASDFNNPIYRTVSQISEDLGVTKATIQNIRARYATSGLKGAVFSKGNMSPERRANMTEEKRQLILDMIHGAPPYGYRRWSIAVICQECEKRGIFEHVAVSVILKLLKEENIDLRNITSQ